MHDCEATRAGLADLLFGEPASARGSLLLAELERCDKCRGEHRALSATLEAFDTAAAESLPAEGFWAGYGERLRERMAQEIRPNIWQPGAAAFALPRAEYRLTFLEDEGLARRLARELRGAARESSLTWPEFKRDPFGFTRRSVAAYTRLTCGFFAQRNIALATSSALLVVTLLVGALFAAENRCSVLGLFSRPCQMAARNPYRDLELIGIVRGTDIPREQAEPEEGPAGNREGKGGGSKPDYARPRGGGGGGRGESLPASGGKLATAQLAPQLLTQSPHPPAKKNPSLPTLVTNDVDPLLIQPDLRPVPFGVPSSEATVASSGPGTGGGMGTGSRGGVGEGDGGGIGTGRDGNIGGGDRHEGGGSEGGGGHGGRRATNYTRPFPASEVTERARILSKPEPGFTEEARRGNVTGVVRLRAVFSASGEVTNITVIKGLPSGLTEKAIGAARQIRFHPALKDGHLVSQWVTLEYNFNIY